jgi:hypothetical protein
MERGPGKSDPLLSEDSPDRIDARPKPFKESMRMDMVESLVLNHSCLSRW